MVSGGKCSDGGRVWVSDTDLSPPPSLSCQALSAGFPLGLPSPLLLVWRSGRYEHRCFGRWPQGPPPRRALACWSLGYIRPPGPGECKCRGLLAKGSKNCQISSLLREERINSNTCILTMMSATLTTGSWVIVRLLCEFILLFIQCMLSFTHFSTELISSALRCW